MDIKFDIEKDLENSVFYPACGLDDIDIKSMLGFSTFFIKVDYNVAREDAYEALTTCKFCPDYDLFDITEEGLNNLQRRKYIMFDFPRKDSEEQNIHLLNNAKSTKLNGYAFLAYYTLKSKYNKINNTEKVKRPEAIKILFVGAEACQVFSALYLRYAINPKAIVIVNPGENVDNWTLFTHPQYRFYNSILINYTYNNAKMPEYLVSDLEVQKYPWDGYVLDNDVTSPFSMEVFKRGLNYYRYRGLTLL